MDGINFIKSHGNEGSIVVVSSDNSHGNPSGINSFITNILTQLDTNDIPIHIVDLNTTTYPSYYIGQQTFYGNDYLYMILSAQTTGELYSISETPGAQIFSDVFSKLCGFFTNFSIYIFPQGGYTYSNYTLQTAGGLYFYDQPVQIVGKYVGTAPLHLMAFAEKDGVMLMFDNDITLGTQYQSDSVTRKMWAAQYLRELQAYTQSNSVVSQIIGTSMDERVLSNYTAFLALEPGQGQLDDQNGNPTSIETPQQQSSPNTFSLYPNPVQTQATLSFTLEADARVTVEIYDLMGKRVMLIADETLSMGEHRMNISAEDLKAGTYICRVSVNGKASSHLKMVVMK
jgi:hypothetical protein